MFILKTVQNGCKDKKKRLRNNQLLRYFLKHIYFTTISLSQTKRANERSEIRTRSWREIALFIKNKKTAQTFLTTLNFKIGGFVIQKCLF